jgi:hypothetical protein
MKTRNFNVAVGLSLITLTIGVVIYNLMVYGIETTPY